MVTPSLDSVATPEGFTDGVGIGDPTALGEPTGLGLGTSVIVVPDVLLFGDRLPMMASAVPTPAMRRTRTTTPAMISIHGVRWTGAGGPDGTT
jgi:hypothetical protein